MDIKTLLTVDEGLTTSAIAPFVNKMGAAPVRPPPIHGYQYFDDIDKKEEKIFETRHKIDLAKIKNAKEEDFDNIQQGDKVLYDGAEASIKRMSFKDRHVNIVLISGGKTIPVKIALK